MEALWDCGYSSKKSGATLKQAGVTAKDLKTSYRLLEPEHNRRTKGAVGFNLHVRKSSTMSHERPTMGAPAWSTNFINFIHSLEASDSSTWLSVLPFQNTRAENCTHITKPFQIGMTPTPKPPLMQDCSLFHLHNDPQTFTWMPPGGQYHPVEKLWSKWWSPWWPVLCIFII